MCRTRRVRCRLLTPYPIHLGSVAPTVRSFSAGFEPLDLVEQFPEDYPGLLESGAATPAAAGPKYDILPFTVGEHLRLDAEGALAGPYAGDKGFLDAFESWWRALRRNEPGDAPRRGLTRCRSAAVGSCTLATSWPARSSVVWPCRAAPIPSLPWLCAHRPPGSKIAPPVRLGSSRNAVARHCWISLSVAWPNCAIAPPRKKSNFGSMRKRLRNSSPPCRLRSSTPRPAMCTKPIYRGNGGPLRPAPSALSPASSACARRIPALSRRSCGGEILPC